VVAEALRSVAPAVSLYVNDFNLPARRAYERVGLRNVGTFASVLF
jgi:predicted GNAT family acetyltransferase